MASYLRVLAESDVVPPLAELRIVLGPQFEVVVEDGTEQEWIQLLLRHVDGPEIAIIERDAVREGELGEQELDELTHEMKHSRPTRAVEWLKHYFKHVKAVYVMQLLSGTDVMEGFSAAERVQAYLWKKLGGILQADNEGFSNREGQHILWQFHGEQSGEVEAAILNDQGVWVPFALDLSNRDHVEAFQKGELPSSN